MENVNAKLQYLKGMRDGISKLDGDRYLLVEEIINTLEVMVVESAKISERMQKEIEKLQSLEFDVKPSFQNRRNGLKRTNYDYFDDITAPFPYKNQPKVADVWYDESLNVGNYLKQEENAPTDRESIKVERICKHCGSYVTCNISADELDHTKIQCPKCKRFLLPFDSNGLDTISHDIDEQIDHLEPPSLTTDIAKRLSQSPKSFHWEVSEEVFQDEEADDFDDHYNINSIIRDFETHPFHKEVESYAPLIEDGEKVRTEEEEFDPEPYEIGRGGLNQAWQYYEERPGHLNFESDSTHEVWKEHKNETSDTENEGAKTLWQELGELEDRPESLETESVNQWKLKEEEFKPMKEEEDLHHDWKLQDARKMRMNSNTEELGHEWKLQEELPPEPEHKEEELNPQWKLQEEAKKKPVREDVIIEHEWKLAGEKQLDTELPHPSVEEPITTAEKAAIQEEEENSDTEYIEIAPSFEEKDDLPTKPENSDSSQKVDEEKTAQLKPQKPEMTKEEKVEQAGKPRAEEENFDWNTDFEFSIDKILSMDKKEKGDANSPSSKTASDSKFNNDDFGKFKYSFDREDEFERQRNKIAPNYNIDKKVLKKFSFLGYASELAKKNN